MAGPEADAVDRAAWAAFASVISSAAASMVSLTVALTAILYALLGTPLIRFLHEKGALNRVLFDLMSGAFIWLVALVMSLLSAHPNASDPEIWMRVATTCALAGSAHFVPLGRAFWLLLRHSDAKPSPSLQHDFSKPTKLD